MRLEFSKIICVMSALMILTRKEESFVDEVRINTEDLVAIFVGLQIPLI